MQESTAAEARAAAHAVRSCRSNSPWLRRRHGTRSRTCRSPRAPGKGTRAEGRRHSAAKWGPQSRCTALASSFSSADSCKPVVFIDNHRAPLFTCSSALRVHQPRRQWPVAPMRDTVTWGPHDANKPQLKRQLASHQYQLRYGSQQMHRSSVASQTQACTAARAWVAGFGTELPAAAGQQCPARGCFAAWPTDLAVPGALVGPVARAGGAVALVAGHAEPVVWR